MTLTKIMSEVLGKPNYTSLYDKRLTYTEQDKMRDILKLVLNIDNLNNSDLQKIREMSNKGY